MMYDPTAKLFEEYGINIKIKLVSLWLCLGLLHIEGGVFTFYLPGLIRSLGNPNYGHVPLTVSGLLALGIFKSIPMIMVLLSLILKANDNRMANLVVGVFLGAVMVMAFTLTLYKGTSYYSYFAVLTFAVNVTIVLLAKAWPCSPANVG